MRSRSPFQLLTLIGLAALVLTACGGSSKKKSSASSGNSGGTLMTVAKGAPSGSPDPQINYTLQEWQLLIISHDGLLAFKRTSGTEGTKIVPDLATEVPKPQNGGKTYVFHIRKGIKFSNGKELKPSDVKYTFERLFKIGQSPNAGTWYNVIVGGDACVKTPATCNLSQGVVADDGAGTVTFHLTKGDPEFFDKLAVPFAFILPTGTPNKEVQIPPPGTGPYKFAEYNPNKQIKLVRNTNFKEWSKDAQPKGNPDEIIQKFGLSAEAEVTQVENGQADWMFDNPPSDRLNEISTKYEDQVHVNPLTAVWYFAFNVRVPPFNNLKARQGVNFATDRNALVKIYGGPKLAVPTCQILPPNYPGYKASLQALSPDIQYPYCQNSKNKVQFCWSSWYQDYPAASDFLNILLGCDSFIPNSNASPNIAEFCMKPIQAQMDQALQQGITDTSGANTKWEAVDKAVTDQAPWVSMFNPKYIDFLSKRVKGYQFSPQWYFLLDQASVK